mgnify:CR=1 FL=1|uniref:MotA/TolQ/ExbB proton channel family protein n=1 Tax=Schlesneria paludicola TaxID=360056 RepID=A0A7C4LN80_9PLAN
MSRIGTAALLMVALLGFTPMVVAAQQPGLPPFKIELRQLFHDGGVIGYIICGLSLAMVALIIEHWLTIRRGTLMPARLAEDAHRLILQGQFKAAEEVCRQRPSFLADLLIAGLAEIELGYAAVEKAMEDAAAQQTARLLRKIEYLSVISTVAPMLGLMGTVWGMILAFMEFERKANPQVSELAPGVYKALITTLFGLVVAVPAIAAFAYFRNRVDELVAQSSLLAEQIFADYKRAVAARRRALRQKARRAAPPSGPRSPGRERPA